MCIYLTPVLYCIATVLIEVYLLCFIDLVSLRDIGKPTLRAEISSPSSSYLKAVKRAYLGSALLNENCYRKKFNFLLQTFFVKMLSRELGHAPRLGSA